jgi:hypothetical protein
MGHPALFDAYPDMKNIETFQAGRGGGYSRAFEKGDPESIRLASGSDKKTALHETQHAIQEREGFAPGSSLMSAFPPSGKGGAWDMYRERIRNIFTPQSLDDYARSAGFDSPDAARADWSAYVKNIERQRKKGLDPNLDRMTQESVALDWYKTAPGEIEARAVANRKDMSPDQRRARPPWADIDEAAKR